jgi:RNA polymerase sigma-70 factor (ECF subfamily)
LALPPNDLLSLCGNAGGAPAWEEFIRRFQPLISTVALRTARQWGDPSANLVDDLVQETYLKVCADNCRLLRNFTPQHPGAVFGFLKVVTANVVRDHFKGFRAAKRGAGEAAKDIEIDGISAASTSQPSLVNQASMERTILLQEIDQHLTRLVPVEDLPRSRLIFWLYYRSGLSASAIASLPNIGLTTKGVESALLRLTRLVRTAFTRTADMHKEKQQDSSQDQKGYRQA